MTEYEELRQQMIGNMDQEIEVSAPMLSYEEIDLKMPQDLSDDISCIADQFPEYTRQDVCIMLMRYGIENL